MLGGMRIGVKPTYIKNVGDRLIQERPGVFGVDFDENKKLVSEHTDVESKVIRNRVAGYITRKLKSKR